MDGNRDAAGAPGELHDRAELFEALSDAAFEAVIIHRAGVIETANRAAGLLAGVDPTELVGRRLMDFIPERSRELVASKIRSGDDHPYEGEVLRVDGTIVPVEVRARTVPVELPGGSARVVALRDLTEKRRLEEHIRNAQKMEAVGRLAGGVAHDFNNLLTVILGGIDLLELSLGRGHPQQADIEPIREAAERAAQLTKQLLTFGRKQVLHPQVVDVTALIGRLLPMIHRVVGEHIQVAMTGGDEAMVEADPMQLEMVMLNLAMNARDAMPDGGQLTIDVGVVDGEEASGRGPSEVRVVVADTGVGMDAATRERIFEPFFTDKPVGAGTGLGLAMVFSIVQQSGGTIHVESEPGEGASFVITLPRSSKRPGSTPPERGGSPASRHARQTILVVEDEPNVRRLVVNVLKSVGHDVLQADGPHQALTIIDERDGPIDLVLTDVVMPRMSGLELVEEIRRRRPDVPAIFMSGYDPEGLASRAVRAKRTSFIAKPMTAEELLTAVARCLGASSDDPAEPSSRPG